MPFLNLKIAGAPEDAASDRQFQRELTAMMAGILDKKADLTVVLIERIPTALSWSVGGHPVSVAAHLDVKITEGTNTPAEKARFVAEAHALLKTTLGEDLPTATYVVLDEVPGNAWGYAGLTQSDRRALAERDAA